MFASMMLALAFQSLLPAADRGQSIAWRKVYRASDQAAHIGEYRLLPNFVGWQQNVFYSPTIQIVKFRKSYNGNWVIAQYKVFGLSNVAPHEHLPQPLPELEEVPDAQTMSIMNSGGQTFKVVSHRDLKFLNWPAVMSRETFTYNSGDIRFAYCTEIDLNTDHGFYAFQLDTAGKKKNGLEKLLDTQWPNFVQSIKANAADGG